MHSAPIPQVGSPAGVGPAATAVHPNLPSPAYGHACEGKLDWLTVTIWILACIWIADGLFQAVPGIMAELNGRAAGHTGRGALATTIGVFCVLAGIGLFTGQSWGFSIAKFISYLRIVACLILIPVAANVAPLGVVYLVAAIAFSAFQLWVLSKAS